MDAPHCMVYIDDVIIFSFTIKEHLEDLEVVFHRLRQANLKLKPQKCVWAEDEVRFLGHVVSKYGVKPDPQNTEKVQSFPTPRNIKHIQQFLGLASYYRRFIQNFAHIAEQFYKLLKKGQTFTWEDAQEKAFQSLKEKLIKPPIMSFPNFTNHLDYRPMPVVIHWERCCPSTTRQI